MRQLRGHAGQDGVGDNTQDRAGLRVMSFNVWTDHPRHPPWHGRRGRVADILRCHLPDVVGGQEFLLPMVEDIAADLRPAYRWLGVGREDGRSAGELNPIFYRPERLELLSEGTFWLAPDPTRPSRGWGAACPRIVTWARFRDRRAVASGGEFFHFNTHFDHRAARARRESARLLLRQITALAGAATPALLTGDLNCRERSAAYALLTDPTSGLRDARVCSETPPLGPRKTWRGLFARGLGAARLDYIFVRPDVRVLRHAVLTDHGNAGRGGLASDHLPVVADVLLPLPSR